MEIAALVLAVLLAFACVVFAARPFLATGDPGVTPSEDEDAAERVRLLEARDRALAALREAGITARGQVSDDDPVQAVEDALRVFGADEVIISTHPPGRSNWIEQNVVERARERCDCPIRHVVVDLAAETA